MQSCDYINLSTELYLFTYIPFKPEIKPNSNALNHYISAPLDHLDLFIPFAKCKHLLLSVGQLQTGEKIRCSNNIINKPFLNLVSLFLMTGINQHFLVHHKSESSDDVIVYQQMNQEEFQFF